MGVAGIDVIGQTGSRWSFTSYLQEEPEKAWLIVEGIRDGKLLDQPKRKRVCEFPTLAPSDSSERGHGSNAGSEQPSHRNVSRRNWNPG